MDLFKDILPSIMISKKDLSQEEGFDKTYNSFIVGRALSYHYDCVMYANEMNKFPNTDKKMQFHYLLHRVRKYKRPFQKWQKRQKNDDLESIKEYYKFSNEKAEDALKVLTTNQLQDIKNSLSKGGKSK
jgi:hypothetical protein